MRDYVVVMDICKHEDYPCCGCSKEPYLMTAERAKEYEADGLVEIIDDNYHATTLEAMTGHISKAPIQKSPFWEFVEYLQSEPDIETDKGYKVFEDKFLDLVAGMEYDETQNTIDDISKAIENNPKDLQGYIDTLWEIFWEIDWSDPNDFW